MSETTKSCRSFSWWDEPSLLDQFGTRLLSLVSQICTCKKSQREWPTNSSRTRSSPDVHKKQTWREGGPRLHRVWLIGLELSDYTLTHLLQLKHHRGASSGCNWAVFTEKSVGDVEPEKNLSTYCKSKPICWTRYIQQEFNKMIYFWLFGGNWTCDI